MKKMLIMLIIALLLTVACTWAAAAWPRKYTSGAWQYILLEDGTAEIVDYRGLDEELTVPAEIDGYRVTSIGASAFVRRLVLTRVTLPDTVTHIGKNPFVRCSNLAAVLVSADHPALESIDGVLFDKAEKRLICCPSANTTGSYAVPQGTRSIGADAFSWCVSLQSVTLPDSLTHIAEYAFRSCEALTCISLPDSLESIGDCAFYDCISLQRVTLPDSVTSCGANPFAWCVALTEIIVSPAHPVLETVDGVLFDRREMRLICYPCAFTAESYDVPWGTRSIAGDAFTFCSLKSVTLPDTVTHIGASAFSSCTSLKQVSLPPALTSVSEYMFFCCHSLEQVTLPDPVTSIGDFAFFNCESLERVTMPESLTSIGNDVFTACYDLCLFIPRNSWLVQWCNENGWPYAFFPD